MHHEKKIVKGTSKKYNTKKDGEKESVSKRIDLGVNSAFDVDEEVIILSIDDFNKLTDGNADEIQVLKNISADKDDRITKLSASNDKLNQELQAKLDLINELTGKLKASEKTVKELKSDVSEKDNIIADNEKAIADKDAEINQLNETNGDLSDKLDKSKGYLLKKDDIITGLEKDLAKYDGIDVSALKDKADKYDAVDIDGLKSKADELDKSKNVIIKLQQDMQVLKDSIAEYKSLVDYKDNSITALRNQGFLDKYIRSKDAIADLKEPGLKNIDISGNMISDNLIETVGKPGDNDDADSGDDK